MREFRILVALRGVRTLRTKPSRAKRFAVCAIVSLDTLLQLSGSFEDSTTRPWRPAGRRGAEVLAVLRALAPLRVPDAYQNGVGL